MFGKEPFKQTMKQIANQVGNKPSKNHTNSSLGCNIAYKVMNIFKVMIIF